MLRSAVSKVMWMGRATVFLVGLAVILALMFGVAATALAGTGVGATFNLGKTNTVDAISRLVGSTASSMLLVDNNGAGTALDLRVGSATTPAADKTVAPMKVDSQGKVANLNSDELDGKDESAFLGKTEKAADSENLDGQDSTAFSPAIHDHDSRYYTETESDARYLGTAQKAADSDLLDGKNSTQFVGASTSTYQNQITITGQANSFRSGTATCNSGDKVLSGGFYGLDQSSYIQASYRNGEGWYIQYFDGGSTATDLIVYAFCADV